MKKTKSFSKQATETFAKNVLSQLEKEIAKGDCNGFLQSFRRYLEEYPASVCLRRKGVIQLCDFYASYWYFNISPEGNVDWKSSRHWSEDENY